MSQAIDPELLAYASPAEKAKLTKAMKLVVAKHSPLDFAEYVSGGTERYPHIELLNDLILALVEHRLYAFGPGPAGVKDEENVWRHPETGEEVITKLAISMPPRHGKSYLVSEHLPAWFIANNPDKRVILASYEADFAASWGLKARRHLEMHPEFGAVLDPSSRAGANWDLKDGRGGMNTAGAGGPLTGKGYHLGIVDDPIKNAEEARSETHRKGLEDWWHSTFFSRREPDAVTLMMFTRWHEDDLGGRLTNAEDDWYVINLPALAFEDVNEDGVSIDIEQGDRPDPLGRKPGEALCPPRYSATQLRTLRDSPTEQGKVWFQALYQGRPSITSGGIFNAEHYRYHEIVGSNYHLYDDSGMKIVPLSQVFRFMTIDLAASTKTTADWTVFSVWDILPENRLCLVDRYRERIDSADHLEELKRYKATLPEFPKVRFIGVEKATYGLTLITKLRRTPGMIVRELNADNDKISRAMPAGQMVTNHQLYWPKNAPWLKVWETEHSKFFNARWDDQVDTTSYAVDVMTDIPVVVREAKKYPTTDAERVEANLKRLEKRHKSKGVSHVLGRWH